MRHNYKVIGVMSGTSLDGLDIAFCDFSFVNKKWFFEIITAKTIPYDRAMKKMLHNLDTRTGLDLAMSNVKFGEFIGEHVKQFIEDKQIEPDFIASHGHTVFHQPIVGLTLQIGSGATIASICNLPVINDFRVADVALGGQGAPLVPIGDRYLFSDYQYCLNLGGIANISYETSRGRVALDIAPCNMVLNHLANQLDMDYDHHGETAYQGKPYKELIESLNNLDYYQMPPPKSLGKEWVDKKVLPIMDEFDARLKHKLSTFCHHVGIQVRKVLKASKVLDGPKHTRSQMLVTGGGAFNKYLIEQINYYNPTLNVTIPSVNLIQFKEALIFGFLGVLRWRNEVNCLRSVTGAIRDNCGGVLHEP
ncbi:MAG: anhydro-N-acetylmuramic acid kinase [Flammeovirgaceae bacterium]